LLWSTMHFLRNLETITTATDYKRKIINTSMQIFIEFL
jgi:hypothetical protein